MAETEEQREFTTEQIKAMSLTTKLYEIMHRIPTLKKSKHNKFGEYNYVPHDEVTKEIRKQFLHFRIMAFPSVTEMTRENSLTRVVGSVEIVNVDNEQDKRLIGIAGMCVLDNDKAYGSALSYSLKYGYLKLFHIETGEMDTDDNKDDKVYDPSQMGDYLLEAFERLKYTPERIKTVWDNHQKDWKKIEKYMKDSAKKQAAEKSKAGKK